MSILERLRTEARKRPEAIYVRDDEVSEVAESVRWCAQEPPPASEIEQRIRAGKACFMGVPLRIAKPLIERATVSERRLAWAVMQAKSELARQQAPRGHSMPDDFSDAEDGSHMLMYDSFDLRALAAVILEAGDSGVNDAAEAAAYRSGMVSSGSPSYDRWYGMLRDG